MDERFPDFFSDPGIIEDPTAYFNSLRAKCPVLREPHQGSVMVTGYKEVMEVLTQRGDVYSSCVSVAGPIPPLPLEASGDDIRGQLDAYRADLPWSDHLVCFDGEKHSTHRSLLTRLLTAGRVKQNEDYLDGLVDRIIDKFIGMGKCNIVPEFAHAITTYAISDLMGIPETHRAELLELLGAPPTSIEGDAAHKVGPDPLVFLEERFTNYIRDRRENPGTDLMSELAVCRFKDGSLPTIAELARLARFLFAAGQDTTSRLIAMAVLILAENPLLQQRLRNERHRIPDFLEETLRYEGPVKVIFRLAQTSTSIGGLEIPAGSVITLGLRAANQDPGYFENPEIFDIDRPRVRDNLAFSRGPHGCPGAPLARLEARVAIDRLLDRIADFRISEEHHGPENARRYRYEPTYSFRSLSDLHIAFTPG